MGTPVEQVALLCEQALSPNTEVVRVAVAQLNAGLKNPQSIILFITLLQQSPNAGIQQFAAVILRKRISLHYIKLHPNDQRTLKSTLLGLLRADSGYIPLIKRSIADVIATLGTSIVPRGDWPELLPSVFNAAASAPTVAEKEIAMYLLAAVTEGLGDQMRDHYGSLHALLSSSLRDANPSIRKHAMQASGTLIPWLSTKEELNQYRSLVPLMVEVVKYFVQNGMDDETIEGFSILGDLVEAPIPVVNTFIPELVGLMLEFSANRELDMSVRHSALSFVQLVVCVKPKLVVKHKLVPSILAAAFAMCANGEGEDEQQQDKEDQEDTISSHVFGAQVIDTIALNLPTKSVIDPALSLVAQYGRPDLDFRKRRAAISAITVLTEGCAEALKDKLAQVVPYIVGALADPSYLVRQATCLAIGQCADNLQPEIIDYHSTVIPALLQGLRDPVDSVIVRCCYALEAFMEKMEHKIVPYLATFMERMGEVMRKGLEIQELAVSAISSASVASGPLFTPYFSSVYELMRSMMMATGLTSADPAKVIVVRARATECVGLCAVAVGEPAKGIVPEAMSLALEGLELEFTELNEFTYGFFCSIAELLKADFAQYLPVVMQHLWKSCITADNVPSTAQLEVEEDEAEIELDDMRTSFLGEKTTACQAIGSFAVHIKAPFIPYIDQSIKALNPLLNYFHEDVRGAALVAIQQIACPIHAAFPPNIPFVNGDIAIPLSDQSREYSVRVLPVFVSALKDKSADVVMRACDSIGEIAQLLGPVAINEFLPAIIEEFVSILNQTAPCQTKFTEGDELEDSDEGEDEGDEDDDSRFLALLDNITECMVDLAHALGAAFGPYMQEIFPLLIKYARTKAHHSLQAAAIGAMAEAIKGANILPAQDITSQLLKLGVTGMANQSLDPDIQRTGAFMCGVLLELGGTSMEANVVTVLQALRPLFDSPDPTVVDNACGAVARIITAFPSSSSVPLPAVLQVLLPALPLRSDHQEDEPVWKCVLFLCKSAAVTTQPEIIVQLVGAMVKGLEQVPPLESTISQDIRATLSGWLPQLQSLSSSAPSLAPLLQIVTNKCL